MNANTTEHALNAAFADTEAHLEKYAADEVLIPMLTKEHEVQAVAMVFIGTR